MGKQTKVHPVSGWVLIAQEEDPGTGERIKNSPWHIAWVDIFARKRDALSFAKEASWNPGYRAVRGSICAD